MRTRILLGVLLAVLITGLVPATALADGGIQGQHVVRSGETLYSIGRAYATRPAAIASTNGISNLNHLPAGVRLAIPTAPWAPIPPGPVATRQFGDPVPPTCRLWHTVVWGETLTLIAWQHNANMWNIARANNIYNLNLIYAGQRLCIP